eukprot:scaffold38596_cov36-Phaeocystis_antarctica.AAC.1
MPRLLQHLMEQGHLDHLEQALLLPPLPVYAPNCSCLVAWRPCCCANWTRPALQCFPVPVCGLLHVVQAAFGDLGPRDVTPSEAIGTMTPMEQLLGEAFAEFEFDEPVTAKVPGSVCIWRCPKETVKEETVKVETTEEETAEKKTAEEETAVEETAEEEIDWNRRTVRLPARKMPQMLRSGWRCYPNRSLHWTIAAAPSVSWGGQTGLSESLAAPLGPYPDAVRETRSARLVRPTSLAAPFGRAALTLCGHSDRSQLEALR